MIEEKWQNFLQSGKISDYLEYKNELKKQKGEKESAVYDRRTCDTGNQFR